MLYLGRKRIASGGGTTTVTAHQFTNNVSDIKPDGASASLGVLDTIVRADHVHPITIATLNSLGVVKPNKALGTSIDANGNLSVEVANSSEIASRTSQTKVIYTGNLNNSVKAALTDANHLTMTSAEQATARSIIGVDTVERLETIYDMESADANINKGYTSGFMFGTGSSMTLNSAQTQDAKLLRVYIKSYNSNFVVDVPIVSASSNIIRTSFLKAYSDSENADGSVLLGFNITILGSSHDAFWAPHATKNSGGTITSLDENNEYYIRKIEGVKV